MALRRIVLSEDHTGRATGFYVEWTCRYRDEKDYRLRPIGGVSMFQVTLLDSGDFRYTPPADHQKAVREYERQERAEFIDWCTKQNPPVDPFDYISK